MPILDSKTSDILTIISISDSTYSDISATIPISDIKNPDILTTIPISDSTNSDIYSTTFKIPSPGCEIGLEEKCLTCNNNKCSSCNLGYILKDGFCETNFEIKGTYYVNSTKESLQIINYNAYAKYLIEMISNEEIKNPYDINSRISFSKDHTVYFK